MGRGKQARLIALRCGLSEQRDRAARSIPSVEHPIGLGRETRASNVRFPLMKSLNIIAFFSILGIATLVGFVYHKGAAGLVALVGFAVMAMMNTWGSKS